MAKTNDCLETDVLIIGCGISGGTAALELADAGVHVTLLTRTPSPEESNTYYAQGGIIYRGEDDSPDRLGEDITAAGAGYNNPDAVEVLVQDGPPLVKELLIDRLEVPFDSSSNGQMSLIREGAHSSERILHVADSTGKAIVAELMKALTSHHNVTLLSGHTAVDLLTPSHHSLDRLSVYSSSSCVGAYVLNQAEGTVLRCMAKCTILATGGLGQVYLRTTNPGGARGDGLAMAQRAGVRLINCEFIQFHPTVFYRRHVPSFLISEAVRGEGARLVDFNGKPFMDRYDKKWKDLAPRDVVARSMYREMLVNDEPNVYLDLMSYIPASKIKDRFPLIYEKCLEWGVDITKEIAPVVPAAHYFCGGIWADEFGQTTVGQLYAVGEVSCTGAHGANRLGSASLLEGLVWGNRSAKHISKELPNLEIYNADNIPPWKDPGSDLPDPALIQQDMSSIQHIMWNYVGLIRTEPRLERALSELRNLETEIERFYRVTRLTDEVIGLRNAIRAAVVVASAAWSNKSSIGCHYREQM